jgi:HK97 family phage portal protein
MDYKQISVNPDQAQFIASRNYNVEDIARIYRVPQHMIQKLDRSTNNNIEQQSLEFLQYCLLPWIKNWEQELDRKLLKKNSGQFFKFNLNALMRGDLKTRSEYYVKALQNGWLSPNEIRELENMNRREDGDIYLVPLNLTTNSTDNGKEDI